MHYKYSSTVFACMLTWVRLHGAKTLLNVVCMRVCDRDWQEQREQEWAMRRNNDEKNRGRMLELPCLYVFSLSFLFLFKSFFLMLCLCSCWQLLRMCPPAPTPSHTHRHTNTSFCAPLMCFHAHTLQVTCQHHLFNCHTCTHTFTHTPAQNVASLC